MLGGGVPVCFRGELGFLQLDIGAHGAIGVAAGEVEHRVVQGVEAGQGDELELVAQVGQLLLERRDLGVRQVLLPVEARRAVVGQELAGELGVDRRGEVASELDVRLSRLDPQQVRVGGEGESAADDRLDAGTDPVEPFRGALAGGELLVPLVDVAGEQVGGEGIRAGDDDGRHSRHVGREASGVQGADVLLRGHEHLAAEVAALLLAGQLVFPVDARGTGLDERLRELVGVQRSAETGLRVGDDRGEPVLCGLAFGVLQLVLADEGVVDATHDGRHGVGGVQRLVRVRLTGEVAVGGDLPSGEIDGLQSRPHLLHGLAPGVRAERPDVVLGVQEVPEVVGAAVGERGLFADRAADADDVFCRVGALDAVPARVGVPDLLELGGRLNLVAGSQTGGAGRRGVGGVRHGVSSVDPAAVPVWRGSTVREVRKPQRPIWERRSGKILFL